MKILQLKIQKERPKLNTDSGGRRKKRVHAILSTTILGQHRKKLTKIRKRISEYRLRGTGHWNQI